MTVLRRLSARVGYRGWRLVRRVRPWIIPKRPVVANVEGSRVIFDLHDLNDWRLFTGALARTDDWYEDYQCFCDQIKPGHIVVDIGAHLGIWALKAAREVGPEGRVVAFEPLPKYYRKILANMALNGYSNVAVEDKVVSNRDGFVEIPNSIHMAESLVEGLHQHGNRKGQTNLFNVPCCTLDAYVEEHNIRVSI